MAWVQDGLYWRDLNGEAGDKRLSACSARCENKGAAWSPDGDRIAFLSDAERTGQFQLYVESLGRGKSKPKRMTDLAGALADLKWSPDGKTIAFLFTENAPRSLGPLAAIVPEIGVIDQKTFVERLATLDLASGAVRQITPEGMYVYEYDWAPDSRHLVYDAAPSPGDDNWYVARLYTIGEASGQVREVLNPRMQIAQPRWSPDGKWIGYIGGLMSDEGSTGGDIYVVPSAGGEARDIMPGRRSSPSQIAWLSSSNGFLAVDHSHGVTSVETIDLDGGSTELWSGAESIRFSGNTTSSAVIRSSWSQPPEVWAGPTGHWPRSLTRTTIRSRSGAKRNRSPGKAMLSMCRAG